VAFVVGLTGGIGSGKSAASKAFAGLGVEVVDTDTLAHELSARGTPGLAAIREAFGSEVVLQSGDLDRARLREKVFADPSARARLEAVLHPLIAAEARHRMAAWQGPYGIVVVPLLLERGGLAASIDRILVVDCPEAEQVRRVVARSGLSEADVRAIMATQLDRARRLAAADDILDNAGPPGAIAPQVEELDRRYRFLAIARRPQA
jgi:dephospho-CoA kinase